MARTGGRTSNHTHLHVAREFLLDLSEGRSDVDVDNLTALAAVTIRTGGGEDRVLVERGGLFSPSTFSRLVTIDLTAPRLSRRRNARSPPKRLPPPRRMRYVHAGSVLSPLTPQ